MTEPAFKTSRYLPTEVETSELGTRIGQVLESGDSVLLEGEIGAGKTHFARAVISSLLKTPEDIPSPTFTIVQTYEGRSFEIWHADLYRLSDSSELVELGLNDAFQTAVVLLEWPERLPEEWLPPNALFIRFSPAGNGRRAEFRSKDIRWKDRLQNV